MILTLASFLSGLLATLFVMAAAFMVLVVLIQKPKGGGLSGAFGGAGGGEQMFGAKVGDVLTVITAVVFGIFLLLGVALVYVVRAETRTIGAISPPTTTPAEDLAAPPITTDAPAGVPSETTDEPAAPASSPVEPAPSQTPPPTEAPSTSSGQAAP